MAAADLCRRTTTTTWHDETPGVQQQSCPLCHTRVTPLWRKDPSWPARMLCNRCGIRAARWRGDQRRRRGRKRRLERLVAVCERELVLLIGGEEEFMVQTTAASSSSA